ncbi:TetR/AcrR family transcriptional regulator [Paenibacillus antri]|uniref:TetR/AcrR family transcriptional regulator n=1 Tax=Paenibacillus antri TaxID=2582848 RepID=A0A5R9GK56_9BACL|nr:TetR/AcrR family transcriptional regulator [Paenibacillus antri]TLS53323.1 TetR/AcrR family transcriptional regulator [Paenibacillus antri]
MSPRVGLDLPTVLRAASELADEQGLDRLSLGELAARLNVRTPSLYNHVEGLPALKRKLALYGLERLRDAMASAAVGKSGDAAVLATSEAYVGFARMHPGVYEATFRATDPNDEELAQASYAVVQVVMRVLEAYGLGEERTLHMIRGLRSILHGFASIEQAGGFGLKLDPNVSFRLLLDTFLAGLRATSGGEA